MLSSAWYVVSILQKKIFEIPVTEEAKEEESEEAKEEETEEAKEEKVSEEKPKEKKAKTQTLSLLKNNESDELYLLIAMIYESLGDIKSAKDNYSKLILFYPESDYFISAKIKTRILNLH